jgi:hypothetical protein
VGYTQIDTVKYTKKYSFSDGLALVNSVIGCYYIDKTGKKAFEINYPYASPFVNGYPSIAATRENRKWGKINKSGDVVYPTIYDRVGTFNDGLATLKLDGLIGYGDETGKIVIPPKYHKGSRFMDGLARVKLNRKWGVIDKKGKTIVSFKFDDLDPFEHGLAMVEVDGKHGNIDKKGREVIPVIYDSSVAFYDHSTAVVRKDGKKGIIDKTGKLVIPIIYNRLSNFSEGLADAAIDDKYGYIDETGTVVIPFIYDKAYSFGYLTEKGIAYVELDGVGFSINKKGEKIE